MTVYVLDGTFNETIGATNVNWVFMPSAKITYTLNSSTNGSIFWNSGYSVTGYGQTFSITNTGGSACGIVSNGGTGVTTSFNNLNLVVNGAGASGSINTTTHGIINLGAGSVIANNISGSVTDFTSDNSDIICDSPSTAGGGITGSGNWSKAQANTTTFGISNYYSTASSTINWTGNLTLNGNNSQTIYGLFSSSGSTINLYGTISGGGSTETFFACYPSSASDNLYLANFVPSYGQAANNTATAHVVMGTCSDNTIGGSALNLTRLLDPVPIYSTVPSPTSTTAAPTNAFKANGYFSQARCLPRSYRRFRPIVENE